MTLRYGSRARRKWRRLLLGAVAIGALGVIGLAIAQTTGGSQQADSTDVTDPGPIHVHGLDIDPLDDALLAATHTGLFRIDSRGDAVRIADRYQDTMGFTVVGPGRYLASGSRVQTQSIGVD